MNKIQMVDLIGQYTNIKKEVDKAIQEVIENTQFINGDAVKRFASDLSGYLGGVHVVPCANGTDALQMALMALDLSPGDEVIVPSFTFISPVEVVALLHLVPVFVDVDPDTFLMLPEEVEKAISPKTRAIIPVHLYGQCADMDALKKIAGKHNLSLVEDSAQAIGTNYQFEGNIKKAGTIGDIGCTSFFPSKNLGCFGDGGAVFTENEALAQKLRMISNHGSKIKYYNDIVGMNSRLDTIQAAVLSVKLNYLDEYNARRINAAETYDQKFQQIPDILTPKRTERSNHTFHQYTIRVLNGKRDALKDYLAEKSIPSMIYYPVPLHKQKAFSDFYGENKQSFKNAELLCEQVLSLPMHTELTSRQLDFITTSVIEFSK